MEHPSRPSALYNLLKMFGLSTMPTVPVGDDELTGDLDEPPEPVAELRPATVRHHSYSKSPAIPQSCRRESLLTRAIMAGNNPPELSLPPTIHTVPRALSTASSQSIPSIAELTSDGDITSPARSASPSPPLLATRLPPMHGQKPLIGPNHVVIAPITHDDKPDIVEVGEAAVEKSLGRKRCIMFACANQTPAPSKELSSAVPLRQEPKPDPAPRKCRLTFVCPTRQASNSHTPAAKDDPSAAQRRSVAPTAAAATSSDPPVRPIRAHPAPPLPPSQSFHEFGTSHNETDAWVDQPEPSGPKLTLDDCNRKENAIRQIAQEAEEEAAAEAELEAAGGEDEEEAEPERDLDEDDFAPSDEESDGGNESDDENGFADSDDESDDCSEYRFWAPAASTAATSADNLTHISSRQRSRSSTVDSADSDDAAGPPFRSPRRMPKAIRMRPGTPELPDSTDFVCGTLDEDRPLEAAFIACREQKKRDKHIPIPQDIDPSFPTSDPENDDDDEDNDDEDDRQLSTASGEPQWLKDQFASTDDDSRGRRAVACHPSPAHTPVAVRAEPPRAVPSRRKTNRSPPPPTKHRSPPARRLFGRSPTRLHSPPPPGRYRSPRGSPTGLKMPLGITINRLAQRPGTTKTASLPQTPNPFFKNWTLGSPATSRIPSGAVTPGRPAEEVRPELHVRGPVDIVIGLEKKRQKRKEKFWRQHCRKAAKEQAERKPVPGRGVERMKELGLECAERTRGYGLGQQAQLVLSL